MKFIFQLNYYKIDNIFCKNILKYRIFLIKKLINININININSNIKNIESRLNFNSIIFYCMKNDAKRFL